MTALTEYFCDFCNRSAQRRDAGDEVTTGYERLPVDFGFPPGWVLTTYDSQPAHKCPACQARDRDSAQAPETEHKSVVAIRPVVTQGWPALASPFDAVVVGA